MHISIEEILNHIYALDQKSSVIFGQDVFMSIVAEFRLFVGHLADIHVRKLIIWTLAS